MNLPLIMMTKITAKITKRRTIAMRTATIGSSLMGLFEAKSVVVAANCFSAGCKRKYFFERFLHSSSNFNQNVFCRISYFPSNNPKEGSFKEGVAKILLFMQPLFPYLCTP